jgi:heme-degrading monooxygenase HmoA
MHAVIVTVTISGDKERALAALREEVVPRASSAPGFVAGYWTRSPDDDRGVSMVVFETQEAAENAKRMIESVGPPDETITLDGVEVREVVANA